MSKDRDRVIHCGAFRRLQRKSQIVGVQSNDFFRTRLTHTMECAQIGRAIALRSLRSSDLDAVVKDANDLPDLVEAGCLAHDLGHPPFGHNGEQALQAMMGRHGRSQFEGNAQSFRIVTQLEPKLRWQERPCGLDLTAATLKAILKYPYLETDPQVSEEHPKFCIYDDEEDREVFIWLFPAGNGDRTLATEILEVADDIAYAAHDFEDGVWAGMIPLFRLLNADDEARQRLDQRIRSERSELDDFDVGDVLDDLFAPIAESRWAQQPFDRSRASRGELKNFCAKLIGGFIKEVTPGDEFKAPSQAVNFRLWTLIGMARLWMIDDPDQETMRFGQRRLVEDLFSGYWANPQMLPHREQWQVIDDQGPSEDDRAHSEQAGQETTTPVVWRAKARLICDHVAGMTDLYALHVHAEMYQGGGTPQLRLIREV